MTKLFTVSERLLEKMPGDDWQKFANLRLLFGFMYAHPGKKLLFMGSELAQRNEFWEGAALDWSLESSPPHRGIQRLLADLNGLHVREHALHQVDFEWSGFEWIEPNDAAAAFFRAYGVRTDPQEIIVAVCNFTPVMREELSCRCSASRLLPRNPQYRFELLRRFRCRQLRRRAGRANSVERPPLFAESAPTPARRRLLQTPAQLAQPINGPHPERSVPRFWFRAKRQDTQSKDLSSISDAPRRSCIAGILPALFSCKPLSHRYSAPDREQRSKPLIPQPDSQPRNHASR